MPLRSLETDRMQACKNSAMMQCTQEVHTLHMQPVVYRLRLRAISSATSMCLAQCHNHSQAVGAKTPHSSVQAAPPCLLLGGDTSGLKQQAYNIIGTVLPMPTVHGMGSSQTPDQIVLCAARHGGP